ncbi:hypothetical protein [Psychroserpens ponticola]|uniref:Uncharacterized protein n=1 Tax=Psychroserpens ponticola TaxID=2932268 RepID=A0ABY7S3B8_9FLAO|nr:hypothetical protein [Psychroserpens ponticola]WCO03467.1 hypothetical protein MUN68_008155 [Psychroserpens ponticola]WCO03471.1 hypothetical protein MUN68_008175 [Psychroserpens ponticola]
MEKQFTSIYRIREYGLSWGIRIQISARIEKDSGGIKISHNLFYENKVENIKLTTQEINLLLAGIKWVNSLIINKIKFPIKIVLEKIELNECDYQSEGLFYAIAFWASETFKFSLPQYEFKYDEENGKYIFPNLTDDIEKANA